MGEGERPVPVRSGVFRRFTDARIGPAEMTAAVRPGRAYTADRRTEMLS
jgi:hypothetical protein